MDRTGGADIYFYVCVYVCDIESEKQQKPCHSCQTFSIFDAMLHKTHNKVLLVLRYQGPTNLGP